MKMTFGFLFVVLAASHMTATVSGLNCLTCKDASSNEECIAQRVTEKCDSFFTACVKWNITVLNTTTGETGLRMTQECGFPDFCANKKMVCDGKNKTIKAPMTMLACNLTCCTSGPDCVNATAETTPSAPTTPTTSMTSTSAPTTKLQAAYTASLWATDMSLCKQKCCGGTPAQIWQNRSCCPVRAGGCLSVALAREVKCEDTYCNKQHCGACQFGQQPLMIMIAAIVSVLYELLL